MFYRKSVYLLFALSLAGSEGAAERLGTVTSSESVTLRGTQVPGSAARSMPFLNGDRILTSTSTARILLDDATRIILDKRSELQVRRSGSETMLCLDDGGMQFSVPEGAQVITCALGRRIEIQSPAEGSVSIRGPNEVLATAGTGSVVVVENATCSCGKKRRISRAVVIIAAAAAAGGGVAAAVAQDEAAVPPPVRPPPPPPPLPPVSPAGR